MALEVKKVNLSVEGKRVLRGLSLSVKKGEVVALMGPNGSGKSSLAMGIAGHPRYEVEGDVLIDGENVMEMTPDERARKGLFLAFQYPVGIPGVNVREMLLASLRGRGEVIRAIDLKKKLEKEAKVLGIKEELLKRDINEGFSGGEKKKMEILQMRILNPSYVVMDETDSGLDIDALKIVAKGASTMAKAGAGMLVITHYQRLLKYLKPDRVIVMKEGRVVDEGGIELVKKLEKSGYKIYE